MKLGQARFIGSFPAYDQAPKINVPEIAIGGRSNVGKSSLMNSLLNRKNLAQVSKTPGKTRMLNYFAVCDNKGQEKFLFVDLPGYGYARVSTGERLNWKVLVEGFIENSRRLRGFILLIDSRRGLQKYEQELIAYLLTHGVNTCPVLTKADKLSRQEGSELVRTTASVLKGYGDNVHFPILHSSIEKTGNEIIWRWIVERINDEG